MIKILFLSLFIFLILFAIFSIQTTQKDMPPGVNEFEDEELPNEINTTSIPPISIIIDDELPDDI